MLVTPRVPALLACGLALHGALLPTSASAASTPQPAACDRQPADPLGSYDARVVRAGEESSPLTVRETVPGSTVRVLAYTQPDTTYREVRTYQQQSGGRYVTALRPARNSRFVVQVTHPDCDTRTSASRLVEVTPRLSLSAARRAPRDYTFSGRMWPVREGKVVSLYRVVGESRVLTAQARVGADGAYRFDRSFGASGAWYFSVESGADVQHVHGSSGSRYTVVH